ncbi:MAG: S-layer homology domain-containing protein [Clostridia bacterium]|nr:S-layer homology domain-containing protein [Clostridia bacterium]
MKLMKKLIASLFIFSLLLSILPMQMTTFAAEDHNARLKKLMDLGIYSVNDDMEYDTECIKRESMASILSVFYGVTEEDYPEETIFEDVSANWASGHIMAMVNNGIMNGYSDGLFRPMSYVTGDAAIKTLVSMAGYSFLAESKGGYPEGYRRMAAELGMLKGIENMDRAANITRGEFTTLLYNALDVPMLQQVTAGATNRFETDGTTTLLSFHLNIYREKGVITALPYVSAGLGEGAGAGKVHLDNVAYLCNLDAYPYLGEQVEVYFRLGEGDLSEIVSIEHNSNASTSVMVDAKDIVSYNNFKFTYTVKDREKSLTVPSDVLVIFNGKPMTYFTDAHMMPKQGNVRFCDVDNNGEFDLAVVTYEVDYHVARINRSSFEISIADMNGIKENKPALTIDTDDDSYHYSVYNAGQACDLEDIQTNEIISIAADSMDLATGKILSSSRIYRIQRCETRVKGMLQIIGDNEIVVDGKTLELSYSYQKLNQKATIGKEYTFYYNYIGKIADFDGKSDSVMYAILVRAGTEGGPLSQTIKVQFFTQDGRKVTTNCADNLQLDGNNKNAYSNAVDYLKASAVDFVNVTGITPNNNDVWQLIKYKEDEIGLITSIDTIKPNVNPSGSDLTWNDSTSNSHTYIDGVIANDGTGRRHTMRDDCMFVIYDPLKTFDIDNLHLKKVSYLRRGSDYPNANATALHNYFDSDEIGAEYVLLRGEQGANMAPDGEDRESVALYLSDIQILNAEGENKDAIIGVKLTTGVAQNYVITDKSLLTTNNINPGDIINFTTNTNGEITQIKKLININNASEGTLTWNSVTAWSGPISAYVTTTCGVVSDRNDQYIRLESPNSITVGPKDFSLGSITSIFKISTLKTIIIYDQVNNKAFKGTIEDIRMANEFGYDGADLVVGYRNAGVLDTIILYR